MDAVQLFSFSDPSVDMVLKNPKGSEFEIDEVLAMELLCVFGLAIFLPQAPADGDIAKRLN